MINNGIGAEFKLSTHKCSKFGQDADAYMAAGGHFGNMSPSLVKHYAEDLGFKYYSAKNKEEFLTALDAFTSPEIGNQSMIFEVFTTHVEENEALNRMQEIELSLNRKAVNMAKKVIGEKGVNVLLKKLGRDS